VLRDNLVGLIEPMLKSAGAYPLALGTARKQSSDDRPICLENPRPEGAESTLTENVASPFHAEPRHHYFRLADHSPRIVGSAAHRFTTKSGFPHVLVQFSGLFDLGRPPRILKNAQNRKLWPADLTLAPDISEVGQFAGLVPIFR
jgi:hypothetical protein